MSSRTLTIAGRSYPLVLPNARDPRLHVAAVIISIHVLGQVALHFRVSVPQILAAILTCAVLEVALTFRQAKAFVWPASAMLTGSGVALILRLVDTAPDDHWTTNGWFVYAAVAGLSLLSKYVIRQRGSHVFNPSNIGLVVAFVVLGSSRVEPLDFWWAPLDVPMLAAYAVILVGGLLITRRLRLLALAGAFWICLAAGTGLLAGSGHCMTANWAFAPVCGVDFWRVIVTSPEVMIFLFFMITDPKTVPAGQIGRVTFGALVAVTSTLLMAPQTDEFGTKVGLLAGLVIVCAARPLVDRIVPEPNSGADDLGHVMARLTSGGSPAAGAARGLTRLGLAGLAVLIVGGGIVAAGSPARGTIVPDTAEVLNRVPSAIDPATLPPITIEQDVIDFDDQLAGAGMQTVVVTLAENLELENQALLRRDSTILPAVDHGDRLVEMQGRLRDAQASGTTVIAHYRFESVMVSLLVPFGRQDGLSLGLAARGTMTEETYDASGALQARSSAPFSLTFAMRRATGARWLNVAVLPHEAARPVPWLVDDAPVPYIEGQRQPIVGLVVRAAIGNPLGAMDVVRRRR
jgi:Na+-translocating ferredoxin:NAD+ oxidoreductase RnfD subunit